MSAQVHLWGFLLAAIMHMAFDYDITHRYELVNVQGTLSYKYQKKIMTKYFVKYLKKKKIKVLCPFTHEMCFCRDSLLYVVTY